MKIEIEITESQRARLSEFADSIFYSDKALEVQCAEYEAVANDRDYLLIAAAFAAQKWRNGGASNG